MKESAALVFGKKLAETTARRCLRAAAALWVDARTREDLALPTCLFAMEYLRYLAEDSESWDETKEHESRTTREEELIRETSSGAFAALCAERPGDRWTILQALVDAEDATRLLLARELTIEEKREFVDLRIEGWLRAPPRRPHARAAARVVAPPGARQGRADARRDRTARRAREAAREPRGVGILFRSAAAAEEGVAGVRETLGRSASGG